MLRYALISLPALLGFWTLPGSLASQQLVPTDTAGVYMLNYVDIDGVAHTVRVEAANRVDVELHTDAQPTPAGYRLAITLRHLDTEESRQPIRRFEVPCPEVISVTAPEGWNARWVNHWRRGDYCYFSTRGASLQPGQEVSGFIIESTLAPGTTTARVFGVAENIYWPSEAGTVPEEVYALADEVRGATGGWLELTILALVGADPPDDPEDALAALLDDLAALCADGAIRPAGLCTSLKAKIREAKHALARDRTEVAVRALESALHELGALPDSRIDAGARASLEERLRAILDMLAG